MQPELMDRQADIRHAFKELWKAGKPFPRIEMTDDFRACEAELAKEFGLRDDVFAGAREFAYKNALTETDETTYPGDGGAGAQPQHHALARRRADAVFIHQLRSRHLA